MGEIEAVQGESEFNVLGVGSGVVLAAYDSQNQVGGCAHFILPNPPPEFDAQRPGKYVAVGVTEMLRKMAELGAQESNIRTALIGGAGVLFQCGQVPSGVGDLGERNVRAVLDALEDSGIGCAAKEVGGQLGRNISFCVKSGVVRVRTGQQSERVLCKLGGSAT
jgi:chemotaxis protein CheD